CFRARFARRAGLPLSRLTENRHHTPATALWPSSRRWNWQVSKWCSDESRGASNRPLLTLDNAPRRCLDLVLVDKRHLVSRGGLIVQQAIVRPASRKAGGGESLSRQIFWELSERI